MTLREKVEEHRQQGRGRRAFWVVLAIGLVVVVAGAGRGSDRQDRAFGQRTGGHESLDPEDLQEFITESGGWLERAGISDEQAQEIAAVLERAAPEIEALRVEREGLEKELGLALVDPTGDLDRIDELRRQAIDLSARAIDQGFYVAVDLADVLTPEQRRELVDRWRNES